MPKFNYTAVNKQNHSVKGTIEASNKQGATETLIKQGYKPIVVRAAKTGFDPNNIKLPGGIGEKKPKLKDIVVFTRQLSTMINAGVPLVRSMATLQLQTENEAFREVLADVAKQVESGVSFAEALNKHPKVFSDIYVNMVRAGEAGGILDEILGRLAQQQEKDASIKKKIKGAMAYPSVLFGITIIAFFGLMIFVIPSIGDIIKDLGGEGASLPPITVVMLGFSDLIIKTWFILLPGAFGGFVLFKRWIKTPKGRSLWHQALLKIPVVKIIISKVAIARFARIFSSLMSSGVAVLEAINITANAIGNDVIEKELRAASIAVQNGKQLSEPLAESKVFPPIVSQMLSIGEETGQTDTILIKVADFYEEEVDTVIDSLSSILEPIMIVFMGGMVGIIAVSVIGPISSLSTSVG